MADNIPALRAIKPFNYSKCYYANLKGWIIRKMFKEWYSVTAFYLCDFTLNYLRYGNYKSYQHVTSVDPTGAVSKADGKIFPFCPPGGKPHSLRNGLCAPCYWAHNACRELSPDPCSASGRSLSPEEHTSLCLGSLWFAYLLNLREL